MRLRTQVEVTHTPLTTHAQETVAVARSVAPPARTEARALTFLHAAITVLPLAGILALIGEALRLKAKLGLWPLPANHPGLEHVALIHGLFTTQALLFPLWLALTVSLWPRLPRRAARCAVYLSFVAATVLLLRFDLWGLAGWLE